MVQIRSVVCCAAAGAAAVAVCAPARADILVYTDRSAWLSAAASLTALENLNNGATLSSLTPTLNGPGITSYFGNGLGFELVSPTMRFVSAITNNRENWSWDQSTGYIIAGGSSSAASFGGTLRVFPSANIGNVGGFGFDWQSTGARGVASTGGTSVNLPASTGLGWQFLGFLSTNGDDLTHLDLNTFAANSNQIYLDNFAMVHVVPTPGACALLSAGVLFAGRRRVR